MSETNVEENLTPPLTEGTTTPLVTGETATEQEGGDPAVAAEETQAEEPAFVPLTTEDLVLPEGFTVDADLQTRFLDTVNNQELSAKDRANALVALQAEVLTKASEASSAAWDKVQNDWQAEVKADPVIGGDNMLPALASVNKLVAEYGSKELPEVFALTGAGNNIHMVKFLHTLAEKLTEGGFTQGQPAGAPQSAAKLLYPSAKG